MDDEEANQINDVEEPQADEGMNTEELQVNSKYLKHFRTSISQFSKHLNGADALDGNVQSSFFPPSGFWTTEEKSLFFHALSVHSKLRPDLIAAEIPGKTIVDVIVYLDLLAEASAMDTRRLTLRSFPPALEVSDEWVAFEEDQADAIAFHEAAWDQAGRDDRRAMALQDEKEAMRRQKQKQTKAVRDREEEKRRREVFEEFQARQEAQWVKEDYMAHLSGLHLRAIDSILREAEEPYECDGDDNIMNNHGSIANKHASAVSDAVIDPELLEVSGVRIENAALLPTEDRGMTGDAQPPAVEDVHLSRLSPRSRRRYKKRLYMRQKRSEASGKLVSQSLTKLKPGRKAGKKKARSDPREEMVEMQILQPMGDPQPEIGQGLITLDFQDIEEKDYVDLHAGKEEFEVNLGASSPQGQQVSGPDTNVVVQDDVYASQSHASGITLPYKVREDLLNYDYDAAQLTHSGLGLFHMTIIDTLMGLHSSLMEAPDNAASCISSETIKILHAEVVCFLKELMYRTISVHEQRRRLKSQTKVWRLGESQINASTVEEAIDMMGTPPSKEHHFRSMLKRLSMLNGAIELIKESDGKVNEHSESEDTDSASSARSAERLPLPSMFREIYAPFIRHESSADSQAPLQRAPPPDANDSDVEGSSGDDGEVGERLEEDELDQRDMELAENAEAELWAKYANEDAEDNAAPDVKLEDSQAWAVRYGQPPGVKSQVFVEDSD